MEGELIAVAFLIFLTPIIIAFALGSLLASELANVFSAGVLLSIAFFHVLAESYSQFEKALPGEDVIDKLRLLNGAFVLGWIFMLWIEKIFFGDQGRKETKIGGQTLLFGGVGGSSSSSSSSSRLQDSWLTPFFVICVFFGLALHSIYVGLVIGLESARGTLQTFALFIFFPVHKAMDGFVIGTQLAKLELKKSVFFSLIVLFSLMTPLGIVLSQTHTPSAGSEALLYMGMLEGVCGGFFLYISTMHILGEELKATKDRVPKLVLFTGSVVFSFVSTRINQFLELSSSSSSSGGDLISSASS